MKTHYLCVFVMVWFLCAACFGAVQDTERNTKLDVDNQLVSHQLNEIKPDVALDVDQRQLLERAEKENTEQQLYFYRLLTGTLVLIFLLLIQRYRDMKKTRDQYRQVSQDLKLKGQQLAEANIRLEHLARSDGLTGLLNRRSFDEQLEKENAIARRKEEFLSLLMLDVDSFKGFNDTYGHPAGDDCLKKIAGIFLKEAQRPEDTVCRYGGEEFAIILGNTPRQGALLVAENIRYAVEAAQIPCSPESSYPYLTISIGVTTLVPASNKATGELIKYADTALYQAKAKGRNCVVFMERTGHAAPCLSKK